MNSTQTQMIINNNQLQVEDLDASGLQEVSLTTVSQNNQGGNETDQTNELDIQKHIMFTMRNQVKEQFVKKVTSLDELKRQYDRKMTARDVINGEGLKEELKQ